MHLVGRRQRHALKGKLGFMFVNHVFDHEVLLAVWSKGCQGVAKRRLQLEAVSVNLNMCQARLLMRLSQGLKWRVPRAGLHLAEAA